MVLHGSLVLTQLWYEMEGLTLSAIVVGPIWKPKGRKLLFCPSRVDKTRSALIFGEVTLDLGG